MEEGSVLPEQDRTKPGTKLTIEKKITFNDAQKQKPNEVR